MRLEEVSNRTNNGSCLRELPETWAAGLAQQALHQQHTDTYTHTRIHRAYVYLCVE